MEFNDEYIFVIVMILLLLFFFRCVASGVLECCITCEKRLVQDFCQTFCGCQENIFFYMLRVFLIMNCFLQPFIFGCLHIMRKQYGKPIVTLSFASYSAVDVAGVTGWTSNQTLADHNYILKHPLRDIDIYEVDALFWLIPYTFCVSITTLVWVNYTTSRILDPDEYWDANQDEKVLAYDLCYITEISLRNLVFIAIYCTGERVGIQALYATLLTLLEGIFIVTSRQEERSIANQSLLLLLFMEEFLIFCVIGFLSVLRDNSISIAVGGIHFMICILGSLMAMVASGSVKTSVVLLLRILLTCFALWSLICFYWVV